MRKHVTGFGNRTRIYYAAGRSANALGRVVIGTMIAAAVMIPGNPESRASDARKGDARPAVTVRVDIAGHAWQCASKKDCAALLESLGCKAERKGAALRLVCPDYRRQLARHSA